jgi:betaine-aldehyde dehydrogenase
MTPATPLLIGGQDLPGSPEAGRLRSINPANGETNHERVAASAADVDLAVRTAAAAAAAPAWRNMLAPQRARLLRRVADLMERDSEHLARLQMIENGKVWSECQAQVKSAASTFHYYAAVCETLGSELTGTLR